MTLTNLMPANDVYRELNFLPERNICMEIKFSDPIFVDEFDENDTDSWLYKKIVRPSSGVSRGSSNETNTLVIAF